MIRLVLLAALLGAAPQSAPKKETLAIPGSKVSFEMTLVPGGKYAIGSPANEAGREADEAPLKEVELRPFWISTREVTWEEYSLFYESYKEAKVDGITRPSQPDVVDPKEPFEKGGEQTPKHPALSIGWYGAMGYCEWLSAKTGRRFRLPTEAEWEAAARAGAAGATAAPLDGAAWHKGNSEACSHEVGSKSPNAWGLHDTLGNGWENCLEPYKPPAFGASVRGGAWNTPAKDVRFANRQLVPDEWAERDPKRPLRLWWLTDGNFVGLRIVQPSDPAPKADVDACAATIQIRNLKRVNAGKRPDYLARVTGEIHYTGSKPLDEVEVTVFYLDEEGKPMIKDPKDKPTFNKVYPVLVNSFHEGAHRAPLKTGESRAFELEVPHPFIEAGPLDLDQVGARITGVHLSK